MPVLSGCAVSRGEIDGFESLRLSNGLIEADILPGLGARIWNLRHNASATQWIWHNPKVGLQGFKAGDAYDDVWAGGWEELFPNDAPGVFDGRSLPDHGEWWSRSWEYEILEDTTAKASVVLRLESAASKTRCEKRITIEDGSKALKISYRIENLDDKPLRFLFKQHLALALGPEHRLELPGGKVELVDPAFGTRLTGIGPFDWPKAEGKDGRTVDLSALPAEDEDHREFVYVSDLPDGWCGAKNTRTGASIRLLFDRKIFPHTWLFMTFGGWRGLYTTVLEPCTNKPKDLEQALKLGQCAVLPGRKTLECEVTAELS